ncbi:MAG TPA: tRNA threonylcarbamoyladenosine dehydratase [Desulfobacteria bacterium]|nr:tRNA threonylcarbamoyladenosine dehydratase [Desulfobacteria bacterium]
MQHKFSRTELIIGAQGLEKLANSKVVVFGVGGVGSYTIEALVRAGIGELVMVDYDEICLTNVNRQLHALHSTVGKTKVEVMKERALDINPGLKVSAVKEFYTSEAADKFLTPDVTYVVDAIDTVKSKISLVLECKRRDIPIICSMGAGNKLNPTAFKVADISETRICPLAKAMRKLLRKQGIERGVKVVYSAETPLTPNLAEFDCKVNCICPNKNGHCTKKRQIPGSISFVPSVVGLIIAGEVVNDILQA